MKYECEKRVTFRLRMVKTVRPVRGWGKLCHVVVIIRMGTIRGRGGARGSPLFACTGESSKMLCEGRRVKLHDGPCWPCSLPKVPRKRCNTCVCGSTPIDASKFPRVKKISPLETICGGTWVRRSYSTLAEFSPFFCFF